MTDFSHLKVGDSVIVKRLHTADQVRSVEHETPTRVTVDRAVYRKSDGQRVGEQGYGTPWLALYTPEACERIKVLEKRREAVRYMRDTDSSKWSDDAILVAAELLRASVKT